MRVKDKQPEYIKNYCIPQSHNEEIDKQVKKVIDDKIVKQSFSEYNSQYYFFQKISPKFK